VRSQDSSSNLRRHTDTHFDVCSRKSFGDETFSAKKSCAIIKPRQYNSLKSTNFIFSINTRIKEILHLNQKILTNHHSIECQKGIAEMFLTC
jgi:hypothetical protein